MGKVCGSNLAGGAPVTPKCRNGYLASSVAMEGKVAKCDAAHISQKVKKNVDANTISSQCFHGTTELPLGLPL